MTNTTIILGLLLAFICTYITYAFTGLDKVKECYRLWLTKEYWTNYNIIEIVSWSVKAVIIIPALLFGKQIWWLYIFALLTSMALIWASNKKLLPTLVWFNTLWIIISALVIIDNWDW